MNKLTKKIASFPFPLLAPPPPFLPPRPPLFLNPPRPSSSYPSSPLTPPCYLGKQWPSIDRSSPSSIDRHLDHCLSILLYQSCFSCFPDREELESFHSAGVITRLCIAVSRDESEIHRYVQDFIRAESQPLAKLMSDEEVMIFVCGDAQNMAKDVGTAFENVLEKEKGWWLVC